MYNEHIDGTIKIAFKKSEKPVTLFSSYDLKSVANHNALKIRMPGKKFYNKLLKCLTSEAVAAILTLLACPFISSMLPTTSVPDAI